MQLFIDNWSATLLAPATASAVSLSVEPAKAALLIGLGTGDFYRLTLVEVDAAGTEIDWDVVQVTAVAAGVLTVTRTGTARSWSAGALIEARLTAEGMEELRDTAGGAAVGSDMPQALGSASPGASAQASRQDHVHPAPTPGDIGAATAAQGALADTAVQPAALTAALADKVDKVAGKGLSSNDYTTAEKNKLAGLEGSHFKGLHASLAALQAAHPTAVAGDYADVDAGAGVDVVRCLWDVTDSQWVAQAAAGGSMTPAQIKTAYESNPDTNAFTDAEQAKLAGIAAGATANANTDSLAEGATNKYFNEGRVRGTLLTGLSLLTGGAITATDNLLSALGKLQKQVSDAVTAIGGKQDTLVSGTNLKTVNGESLLGSGDLAISSGSGALPVVQALSASRNMTLADINTFNVNSTTNNYTATIQPQSTVAWTADAEIHFLPSNTGDIVVTAGAGVSLNGVVAGSVTLSTQNGAASIKRLAADSWWIGGATGGTELLGDVAADSVRIGKSGTASNNFTWRNLLDGLLRLSRGNADAPITDVMRVKADNSVEFPGGVASGVLGAGQTWQNVTDSRALNTTYTNTTGKPIYVSISISQGNLGFGVLVIAGTSVGATQASTASEISGVTGIVQPGETYGYTITGGVQTLWYWSELR